MKLPLDAKQLASVAFPLALAIAPPTLAEMRVIVTEDGTIQFVHQPEKVATFAEVTVGAGLVGSKATLAPSPIGSAAGASAAGSIEAATASAASSVASPSASASVAAKLIVSGSVLADTGKKTAVEAKVGGVGFAEAPPTPQPPPVIIVTPEEAQDPITTQLNACETISFGDTVLFDTARHDIKPQAGPALDAVAKVLLANSSIAVRVEGHTDSRGGVQYNQELSERRANAVHEVFLRRGVPVRQMKVVGYGLTQPVANNDIDAGRASNRRVDLVPLNC